MINCLVLVILFGFPFCWYLFGSLLLLVIFVSTPPPLLSISSHLLSVPQLRMLEHYLSKICSITSVRASYRAAISCHITINHIAYRPICLYSSSHTSILLRQALPYDALKQLSQEPHPLQPSSPTPSCHASSPSRPGVGSH